MSVRRKQEEKHLQLLREQAAQPHNKQCLDCGQRGPTYVNMTIGSFVCTSCSGRLRGLTPPHRVKSISMASFSAEEIEFIKQRGNEWCRAVWLGMFDPSRHPAIDMKDDTQIKDFMAVKYEKKRYYVEPSVAFKEKPAGGGGGGGGGSSNGSGSGQLSPASAQSVPDPLPPVKPLSKLAGASVKPITLNHDSTGGGAALSRPAERKNIDLLADLSPVTSAAQADPFSPTGRPAAAAAASATAPAAAAQTAQTANFANFANFDALNAAVPQTGVRPPAGGVPTPFANFSSPAAAMSAVPISTPAAPAPAPAMNTSSASDRYAALKELDEVLKTEVEPKIDWASGAGRVEPAVSTGQGGWAAFGSVAPGPPSNGASPYGQSPQQHSFPAQFATHSGNGFSAGAPWSQPAAYGVYAAPAPGYGGYRQPYRPAGQFAGPMASSDMGGLPSYGMSNGSNGLLSGVGGWPIPGQQTAGWGAAPAPPTANPFMPNGGLAGSPANPHNPFL